ncbi:hypothetical protein D9615_006086 [Tricholomella constricta]|uniref:Uncharacterized protein n=1 Tax=Tricholomella constricta TaxID=117010 RepID=A0A8H5H9C1_9AGAR|nr:hypothetical protein D9615_006086 [Tricholomella constricta]
MRVVAYSSAIIFTLTTYTSQCEAFGAAAQLNLLNLRGPPDHLESSPYFSWTLSSSVPDVKQTSYQLVISRHHAGASDIWNSGVVRIETDAGSVSASSEFDTGVFSFTDPTIDSTLAKRQTDDALARTFRITSQWVWTLEHNLPYAPAEDRAFRRTYAPPSGVSAISADILITADNGFTLYINGHLIGSHADWLTAQRYHVSLYSGTNVFAIHTSNNLNVEGEDSTAGLLVAIQIAHSDGSTVTLVSDKGWRATKIVPVNFETPTFDDSAWGSAVGFAGNGTGPWLNYVKLPTVVTTVNLPSPTSSPLPSSPSPSTSSDITSSSSPATSPSQSSPTAEISTGSDKVGINNPSVTQDTILPSSTTSSDPIDPTLLPSDNSDSSSTSKPSAAGPIAGGIVGGIVILILLIIIVLYRKRLFKHTTDKTEADPPAGDTVSEPFTVRPFTSLAPSPDFSGSFTGQHKSILSERKHELSSGLAVNHQRLSDFVPVSHPQGHDGGSGAAMVGGEALRNRMQRLEELVTALNRQLVETGESSPSVADLRGRIAELTREESQSNFGLGYTNPPPYLES